MSIVVYGGIGSWKTGAVWAIAQPRVMKTLLPGVVFCPGGPGDAAAWYHTPGSGHKKLVDKVAEKFPVMIMNDVGSAYGNASDRADFLAAKAFLQAQPGVIPTGPVGTITWSQGFNQATTVSRNNANTVACIAGITPSVDLEDLRTFNRPGGSSTMRSQIDTAWGVTYPAPLPAGANPMQYPPTCPFKIWGSDWDDVCVWSTLQAMCSTNNGYGPVDVGDNGHSDLTVGQVNPDEVIAFLSRHLL